MSKKSMNERLSEVHTDMKYSELGDVTSWKFYVVEVVFQFFLFVLASIIMTCSFPTLEDRMPAVPLEPQLQPVEESQECRDCCRLGGVCVWCVQEQWVCHAGPAYCSVEVTSPSRRRPRTWYECVDKSLGHPWPGAESNGSGWGRPGPRPLSW